jgi:hypothetical protein
MSNRMGFYAPHMSDESPEADCPHDIPEDGCDECYARWKRAADGWREADR